MKLLVAIALFAAVAVVAVPLEPEPDKILRSEFDQQLEGKYVFNYETEDGIIRSETGEIKQVLDEENKPLDVVVVRGSYSYTNPESQKESVSYYADETVYHAEGDSIPKAQK